MNVDVEIHHLNQDVLYVCIRPKVKQKILKLVLDQQWQISTNNRILYLYILFPFLFLFFFFSHFSVIWRTISFVHSLKVMDGLCSTIPFKKNFRSIVRNVVQRWCLFNGFLYLFSSKKEKICCKNVEFGTNFKNITNPPAQTIS